MSSIDSFIDYLVHNIPYYEQYGGSTSLEELPIVNKQVIRNNYDAFISMDIPKEDGLQILNEIKEDAKYYIDNSYASNIRNIANELKGKNILEFCEGSQSEMLTFIERLLN